MDSHLSSESRAMRLKSSQSMSVESEPRRWSFKASTHMPWRTRTKSSSHILSTTRSYPPPPPPSSSRSSFSKFFNFSTESDTSAESWGTLVNRFRVGLTTKSSKNENSIGCVDEEIEYVKHIDMSETSRVPNVINGKSDILSNTGLALLETALPEHEKNYNWILLFSSMRDGSNFIQFYEKVRSEEPTYVVVETLSGEVFGGYAASIWRDCCKEQYYGHGECFLFKLRSSTIYEDGDGFTCRAEGRKINFDSLTKFMWTAVNPYFQYSMPDSLGFGGGGDDFGLFIAEDFAVGSSGRCATFDNEPLCNASNDFTICQVEVYGFTSAKNEIQARLLTRKKQMKTQRSFRR